MRPMCMQVPSASRGQDGTIGCQHLKKIAGGTRSAENSLCLLKQGRPLSTKELVQVLQKCRKEKDVQNGELCYTYLCRHGLQTRPSIGNFLVPMLVSIRRIDEAEDVFDRLPFQSVHSWNSLLAGFVNCGKAYHALALFKKLEGDSLHPNEHTFVAVLSACAKLVDKENGCEFHAEIARRGFEGHLLVGSTLVHMYVKCGLLALAQEVFNGLNVRDAITWTSLIAGYVKFGHNEQALVMFDQMQTDGLSPNPLTYVSSLKACSCVCSVEKGQLMHAEISRRGLLKEDIFVANAVIDMYAKYGLLSMAQEVFNNLPNRDLVSWNALITGYANAGKIKKAFDCFYEMQLEKVSPDPVTFVCNLKACADASDPDRGQQMHIACVVRGFAQESPIVGNSLVDLYASCGLLAEAQKVFDGLKWQDSVAWTALISGFTKYGHAKEALEGYERMQLKGVSPDAVTYSCSLKACSSLGDIRKGQEIEAEIERLQLPKKDASIGPTLIEFYANCGLLENSQDIFDTLPSKDVESWNALMSGYVTYSYGKEALQCFEQMQEEEVCPNANTLVHALKACCNIAVLAKGHEIHDKIVRENLESLSDVGSALMEMYFSCSSCIEAKLIFERLPDRGLSSWNTFISGCINLGFYNKVLSYLDKMSQGAIPPDACTYACGLKACGILNAEHECYRLHAEIIKKGFLRGRYPSFVPSLQITVLWNALVSAYLTLEQANEAFLCCKHMHEDGFFFDVVSYICSLKASETSGNIDEGNKIHVEIVKLGLLGVDLMIDTALIDMYAAFLMLAESLNVFNRIIAPDVIAWNALISGFMKHGMDSISLDCLERMKLEGILPNDVTYLSILKACGNMGALKQGQNIHSHVSEESLETDMMGSALVGMYAKCGSFAKSQVVLQKLPEQNVSSWNALIAGCSRSSLFEEALSFYDQMHLQGVAPDAVTFVCSLKACTSMRAIKKGHEMHSAIIKRGFLRREFLIGNGIVDMYAKCGCLAEAHKMFDTLPVRDTVSWNTLIAGYLINECAEGAMMVSKQMHRECTSFDTASYLSNLKACGSTSTKEYGFILHSEIVKKGMLEWSLATGNALIDMYVCCGSLVHANCVLHKLTFRDVVSWTTVIAGFLRNGFDNEALLCLEVMQQEDIPSDVFMWNALIAGYSHLGEAEKACCILGKIEDVKPDEDSFQSILAVCSHTGLVDKGETYVQVMDAEFGVTPSVEHFTCMVDLFGRAGQLYKALFVINRMPWQPDVVSWHTLMAACQKLGNVDVGLEAFEAAIKLDERDSASFVSMYNIFAGSVKVRLMVDAMEEVMQQ